MIVEVLVSLLFISVGLNVFFMLKIKQNTVQFKELQKRENQLNQEMLSIAFDTQETERKRISEDLHDSIGNSLMALKIYLSLLERRGHFISEPVIRDEMNETVLMLKEKIDRIIKEINPMVLEKYGLSNAILQLIDKRINKLYTVNISFSEKGKERRLTPQKELMIYRIVQELITNSIKYNSAWYMWIDLDWQTELLVVQIKDDGLGFSRYYQNRYDPYKSGFGLLNIRNRLKVLNADLKIFTEEGKSCAAITIPYKENNIIKEL